MTAMTAAQRASLAKLRIYHPRATVTLVDPRSQTDLPMVRIKMHWRKTTLTRWIWLAPDGARAKSVGSGRKYRSRAR